MLQSDYIKHVDESFGREFQTYPLAYAAFDISISYPLLQYLSTVDVFLLEGLAMGHTPEEIMDRFCLHNTKQFQKRIESLASHKYLSIKDKSIRIGVRGKMALIANELITEFNKEECVRLIDSYQQMASIDDHIMFVPLQQIEMKRLRRQSLIETKKPRNWMNEDATKHSVTRSAKKLLKQQVNRLCGSLAEKYPAEKFYESLFGEVINQFELNTAYKAEYEIDRAVIPAEQKENGLTINIPGELFRIDVYSPLWKMLSEDVKAVFHKMAGLEDMWDISSQEFHLMVSEGFIRSGVEKDTWYITSDGKHLIELSKLEDKLRQKEFFIFQNKYKELSRVEDPDLIVRSESETSFFRSPDDREINNFFSECDKELREEFPDEIAISKKLVYEHPAVKIPITVDKQMFAL